MVRAAEIINRVVSILAILLILFLTCNRSAVQPADKIEQIRVYTRNEEFNYLEWMLEALQLKQRNTALASQRYLNDAQQQKLVYDYLDLVGMVDRLDYEIAKVYADPSVSDPAAATAAKRADRDKLLTMEDKLAELAEAIIQAQVSAILKENDLTLLGQPIPAVMYHVTPLPYALIVSPRDHIEQEAMISLLPNLPLEERIQIEEQVSKNLNKSALVVGIGGVGVYPTMVESTTDLNWLVDTVAHEWSHNYLELRPLGLNYDQTPELRTINETTASIVGREIGRKVIARFYPERLPPEETAPAQDNAPQPAPEPPKFEFNKEMRITRLGAEELLKQGKIDEAEAYMEARRKFFWDNGYLIRKLNQAYFAFHGAYNDQPGGTGAAGKDPVGPAVQQLRKESRSLADFLNRISWIWSYEQLKGMTAPK